MQENDYYLWQQIILLLGLYVNISQFQHLLAKVEFDYIVE